MSCIAGSPSVGITHTYNVRWRIGNASVRLVKQPLLQNQTYAQGQSMNVHIAKSHTSLTRDEKKLAQHSSPLPPTPPLPIDPLPSEGEKKIKRVRLARSTL